MEFKDFCSHALMDITPWPELVFAEGQGSWLTGNTGKTYFDFVQGWTVNSLGHSPALIAEVRNRQVWCLITPSPAYFNEPSIQLANGLVSVEALLLNSPRSATLRFMPALTVSNQKIDLMIDGLRVAVQLSLAH